MKLISAPFKLAARLLKLAPVAAIAGVVWSSFFVDRDLPLPSPVAAEPLDLPIPGRGRVAVYRRGPGNATPVLLVHSVNAAASAAEMRPLFDHLSARFDVTAIDLPGYGKSDRQDIVYDIEHMTAGIVAALEHIGRPTHVVALSLGAEFAARAETLRPALVASLTLISPTGFHSGGSTPPEALGTILRTPVVGQTLYDVLTSTPSIRYYLAKSFVGEVDPGLASYSYLTAHQPNARHAPAAFLSGALFTRDVAPEIYAKVTAPAQVLYDEDPYSSFDELAEFVSHNHRWTARNISGTKGLPHFDATDETVKAITQFIEDFEADT